MFLRSTISRTNHLVKLDCSTRAIPLPTALITSNFRPLLGRNLQDPQVTSISLFENRFGYLHSAAPTPCELHLKINQHSYSVFWDPWYWLRMLNPPNLSFKICSNLIPHLACRCGQIHFKNVIHCFRKLDIQA